MSHTLCDPCKKLPSEWLIPRFHETSPTGASHHWTHASWTEFQKSAESCSLCSLVRSELRPTARKDFFQTQEPGIRFTSSGFSGLEVWCVEEQQTCRLTIGLDGDDINRVPPESRKLFQARIISPKAGDDKNIATIKSWLHKCTATHTKCSSWGQPTSPSSRYLPTRVLDVGDSNSPTIRLHEPKDDENEKYIALSYCWGKGNPYLTDRANLQRHLDGDIKLSDLPKTLSDAVELTRKLGVKYIWIDALCIVQDHREDWIHEAAMMDRVYLQAYLTIAASASADTMGGLFTPRTPRHETSAQLSWPQGDGKEPITLHILPTFDSLSDEQKTSPLATRGWTFQERALSGRTLHFGAHQSHFECQEASFSESSAPDDAGHRTGDFFEMRDMAPTTTSEPIPTHLLHSKWAWVVSQFSSRRLTAEGDVFAALGGIAALFAGKDALGKYFCGLWEDEIHRHLLWYSDRDDDEGGVPAEHTKPAAYRAPSWSWAAVKGPVRNRALEIFFRVSREEGIRMTEELGSDGLRSHKLLHVRAIKVEVEGSTSFGPVIEAVLKVTGVVYPVRRARLLRRGEYALQIADGRTVGNVIWDVDEVPARETNLWICPVMQRQKIENGWAVSDCLILRTSGVNMDGELTFERAGVGRTTNFWVKGAVHQDFTLV
ncbi:HET-domain-containing protein [Aaosphaeria arxii CBS 175.79]|uniref:HET-domain-containing protein n=1 Tax=Aaosphaeria arxii CBS 175.79 TaxID=1450172 RepID=A0A6A5Y9G1_9PLEO|nr:HET-domain-containing protein [Aaosphaeria arxii CBS 175.79]KAF2021234.1 HET-domain-containing protein [Aaosphaeria arxii CBS 175.79]